MVTFNKPTTLVVWIFFLTKLNGRQRDKFFQSHGTLRVNWLFSLHSTCIVCVGQDDVKLPKPVFNSHYFIDFVEQSHKHEHVAVAVTKCDYIEQLCNNKTSTFKLLSTDLDILVKNWLTEWNKHNKPPQKSKNALQDDHQNAKLRHLPHAI